MNIRRSAKNLDPIPRALIERCRELGLVSWRLDLNGMPVEEPEAPSMLGLWLSARPLRMLMAEAAMHWTTQDTLDFQEIYPGLWIFPFIEEHRDRRTGYFVAAGFSPEILESDLIDQGCKGNQLQLSALRHLLKDRATLSDNAAPRIMSTLAWMLEDLRTLRRNEETIELFSEQLGDSYEVVTTLQDLGCSMGSLHEPDGVILDGITEIASTLDYTWVACIINTGHDIVEVVKNAVHQAGTKKLSQHQLDELQLHLRSTEMLGRATSTEIYPAPSNQPDLEPQILLHPIERGGERLGVLLAGGKNGDDPQVSSHETRLMESISGMLGAALENAELYHRQHLTFIGTIKALSAAIDAKDQYTRGHSERVAMLSAMLAKKIGYSADDAERVRISGLVHDVGKIGVPESVLCKPARLSDAEFDLIKTHPRVGFQIMKDIPELHDILPGVLYHHERWDGNGYPDKLAGEEIPQMARIMALADTFDAMSSNRAYRSGLPREKVFAEFRSCAGTQFDPNLVEPFLALEFSYYDNLVAEHKAQTPIHERAA